MRNGFTRRLKPLEMIGPEQVEQIQSAALDILSETGVIFAAPWALEFLRKEGCQVDMERRRARIPAGLVQQCLPLVPSSFRAKARHPKDDLIFGGNTVHFTHSAGMQSVNLDTFEPRPASRQDYVECVTVLDALPTISHLACYPYYGYEGAPASMSIPESVAMKMRYSTKHQFVCYAKGCEVFNIAMAQAIGVEITGTVTATPPLMWDEHALSVVQRMTAAGFPIGSVDGYTLGSTAPATTAGAVALATAQHLSLIVLVQLMHPGHRMSVGHFALPSNMATGSPLFGDIGASLSNAMWNQVWRAYNIPRSNGSPGYVSAKVMDYQAGYEKAMAALLSALSGANYILLHLGVSGEMTAHPVQAILDDDIAGMIGRFIEGEEVRPETLPLELIEEVGPVPGQYLDQPHTRDWWRKGQYPARAADRMAYPEWLTSGKKTALDYAKVRMEQILATHHPLALTPSQDAEIERILGEARDYYRRKGA